MKSISSVEKFKKEDFRIGMLIEDSATDRGCIVGLEDEGASIAFSEDLIMVVKYTDICKIISRD